MRSCLRRQLWFTLPALGMLTAPAVAIPHLPIHGTPGLTETALKMRTPVVAHEHGVITSVRRDGFTIRDESGAIHKVIVTRGTAIYRLEPGRLNTAEPGWFAHAIGPNSEAGVRTRTLVLFPPSARAGVPPVGSQMEGVGEITHVGRPLALRGPAGPFLAQIGASTMVLIARPVHLNNLHAGDMAMAFGHHKGDAFVASVIHIPPRTGPAPGGAGKMRGPMSGKMNRM